MICTPKWTKYFRYEMSFNYNPIKYNHYFKRFHFILFSFYIYPFLPPRIFVHSLHDWCGEARRRCWISENWIIVHCKLLWILWVQHESFGRLSNISNCWAFFSVPDATIINYISKMRILKSCKSKLYFATSVHINHRDYPDTNCIVHFPFTLSLFSLWYTIKFHFAIIRFY